MPCVPGFKKREGCAIAHLADDDAIRSKAHRTFEQAGHINAVTCVEKNGVLGGAPDLRRIFEDHQSILWRTSYDFVDHCVG